MIAIYYFFEKKVVGYSYSNYYSNKKFKEKVVVYSYSDYYSNKKKLYWNTNVRYY